MDKEEFIEHFVVAFLATWCANEYNDACLHDRHQVLEHPPVEDAYYLAERAFEERQKIND